jgi:ABC-type cobalamin/Fe3+-siderophores transport system ATPase subunit
MLRNTIFHLIGFPGTGKRTIASEICAATGAVLVDNHLINRPIFAVIPRGVAPSQRVWDNVGCVRAAVLDTIAHISPPDWSFVLTNVLLEDDPDDRRGYESIKAMAGARGAAFVPVRLHISVEENTRRIVNTDRAEHLKLMDPGAPARLAAGPGLLRVAHPNLLEMDVTDLSAAEAAARILAHAQGCAAGL